MPSAKASRGSRTGRADSLMSRLTTATTASEPGRASAAPRARRASGVAARRDAGLWRTSIQATQRRRQQRRARRGRRAGRRAAGGAAGASDRVVGAGRGRGAARRGRRRAASSWHGARVASPLVGRRLRAAHQAEQRRRDLALAPAALARQQLDRVQRLVARVVALGGEGRRAPASAASACWSRRRARASRRRRSSAASVIALLTLRLSAACAAGSARLDLGEVRRDAIAASRSSARLAGVRWSCSCCAICARNASPTPRWLSSARTASSCSRRARLDRGRSRGWRPRAPPCWPPTRSASRRRFSTRTTRSVVGSAHSSPSVSSRTPRRPQVVDQQVVVEGAVGVGDEGPGDAVDARQADQRLVLQDGQLAEVAARQAVLDLARLRFDQVEVVEQPFGRRADVVAGGRMRGRVALRLAQDADVVAQAREEGARRACARTPRRGSRRGCGRAARSARGRRSRSGWAVRAGRAWRRGSRPARPAHRAPAAAGRTLSSGG